MVYYHAQIDENNICIGVSQNPLPIERDDMIQIDSYDLSLLRKVYQDGEWVENPNPPEPIEPVYQPTNAELAEKLDAQQALQLSGLQGQADQYTVALSTQEQVTSQQQLNLTALQGIADIYATLLTMQAALTPTTTPETEE